MEPEVKVPLKNTKKRKDALKSTISIRSCKITLCMLKDKKEGKRNKGIFLN